MGRAEKRCLGKDKHKIVWQDFIFVVAQNSDTVGLQDHSKIFKLNFAQDLIGFGCPKFKNSFCVVPCSVSLFPLTS